MDSKRVTAILIFLLLSLAYTSCVFADNVYLKNGKVARDVIVVDTVGTNITIRYGIEYHTIAKSQVIKIERTLATNLDDSRYESYDVKTTVPDPEFAPPPPLPLPQPQSKVPLSAPDSQQTAIGPTSRFAYDTSGIYEYPNLKWLAVTAIAGLLAYDYFDRSSKIGDEIEVWKRYKLPTNSLESERSAATVKGILALSIGVVTAIIALDGVRVEASSNKISLSVLF